MLNRWGKKISLDLPYFVKNGFWAIIRQVALLSSGLLLFVVFARLTSQEIFGEYQLILSIMLLVSIVSIPGLNTSVLKSVAEGFEGDYRKSVRYSFIWSLAGIPIFIILGIYYYVFRDHGIGLALMVVSVFFPFIYAPNTWDYFLQGKKRFDVATKYCIAQASINALAMLAIIFISPNNIVLIITVYLISYAFFSVVLYYRSLKYVENDKCDKNILKYGMFLTKLSALGFITANIDKILIGIFLSPASLAVYGVGILFAKQLQDNTKSLMAISTPKQIEYKHLLLRHYIYLFLGGVVITVISLFIIKFIIPLLFSEKYASSIFISQISILFYPFFIISTIYKNQFLFSNKKKILFRESIISPLVKVIMTVILLPLFGIGGLAFLFGFQYVIIFAVLFVLNKESSLRRKHESHHSA